ncbi:MAG: GGDEF domain-containing protein [Gammaproteobacteria bacterium]
MKRILEKQSRLFRRLSYRLMTVAGLVLIFAVLWQFNVQNREQFRSLMMAHEEAEFSHKMRDAVRLRQLSIQRMLNARDVFEQDEEYQRYLSYGSEFLRARNKLKFLNDSQPIRTTYRQLLDAVNFAQPYHAYLIESIMFGSLSNEELWLVSNRGSAALQNVLEVLDRLVALQQQNYIQLVENHEQSRESRWMMTSFIFIVSILISLFMLRRSDRRYSDAKQLSTMDGVSGIYNRRYFDMVLEDEWRRSMREYTPISLIMIDIDFFKAYNDRFGHLLGDTCLFSVASILGGQLKRAADFIARYGGEEFVILLPKTNLEYARKMAEHLRQALQESQLQAGNEDVSPWLTVSIGVASTIAQAEQSSSALVRAADQCLYQSKSQGRNRVTTSRLDQPELVVVRSH